MAAIIGGVIAAVGGLAAANESANATENAAVAAAQTNQNGLQLNRADAAPWRRAGGAAVNRLAQLLGISNPNVQQNYEPTNLVDTSGGTPKFNAQLYATDDLYRTAVDRAKAAYERQYGEGARDMDPTSYANELTAQLRDLGAFDRKDASVSGPAGGLPQRDYSDPSQFKIGLHGSVGGPIEGGAPQGEGSDDFGALLRKFTGRDLENEPGYQFRLKEGLKGIDRGAAARGGFDSGATLKALQRYSQDYASGEYTNAFNRDLAQKQNVFNMLSGVSGTGQVANQALGQQNAMAAMNNASNVMTGGMARAQATLGGAAAANNAIQGGLANYYYNQRTQAMNGGGGGGGTNGGWGDTSNYGNFYDG